MVEHFIDHGLGRLKHHRRSHSAPTKHLDARIRRIKASVERMAKSMSPEEVHALKGRLAGIAHRGTENYDAVVNAHHRTLDERKHSHAIFNMKILAGEIASAKKLAPGPERAINLLFLQEKQFAMRRLAARVPKKFRSSARPK